MRHPRVRAASAHIGIDMRQQPGWSRPGPEAEPAATVVAELTVTGFRSYASLTLALDACPVVLTGANGAGKTNLLEAVSLLTPGRGLRGADLEDLVHVPRAGATANADTPTAVSALVACNGEAHRIGTGVERVPSGWRRPVRIDGTGVRAEELAHYVRAVWLTPAMDRLFMEGAGERRRFIDRLAVAHEPRHAAALIAYERALRERQRLLKDGVDDAVWLGLLEQAMAAAGVPIAETRLATALRLEKAMAESDGGAFPRGRLALEGEIEKALAARGAAGLGDEFRDRLAQGRRRDAEAGRTLCGPHRSDLEVRHAVTGRPAGLCSTGEQKALLLALVLAQARAMAAEAGPPLLLFDEVAAHLDETRRAALFDEVTALGCQAWLTGTERSLFSPFGARAQYFSVAEDRLLSVHG